MSDGARVRLRTVHGGVMQHFGVRMGIKHMDIDGNKVAADYQVTDCMRPVLEVFLNEGNRDTWYDSDVESANSCSTRS